MKHVYTITENQPLAELPWPYVHAWGPMYLDLAAIAASVSVLLLLLLIVPSVAVRFEKHPYPLAWLSGVLGAAFGAILVLHGYRLYTSWVNLAYMCVVVVLTLCFYRIVQSGSVRKNKTAD